MLEEEKVTSEVAEAGFADLLVAARLVWNQVIERTGSRRVDRRLH